MRICFFVVFLRFLFVNLFILFENFVFTLGFCSCVLYSDSNGRCEHILQGVHHGAEKLLLKCAWSYDGEYVSAGSADRLVHMWETSTGMYVSAWPGHKASVNQVMTDVESTVYHFLILTSPLFLLTTTCRWPSILVSQSWCPLAVTVASY